MAAPSDPRTTTTQYTYFEYDAANRIAAVRNCLADGSRLAYFEYGYDAASRIVRVRREDARHVYYEYDDADGEKGPRHPAPVH